MSRSYKLKRIYTILLLSLFFGISLTLSILYYSQYVHQNDLLRNDTNRLRFRTNLGLRPEAGFAIAIINGRKTSYFRNGSLTSKDFGKQFEIGSATKILTGLLLADAIAKRQVSPSDTICKYINELKSLHRCPTFSALASNFSKLPKDPYNLRVAPVDDPYVYYDDKRLIRFTAMYLKSQTGIGGYSYSNVGFSLLGLALARRAEVSYSQLIKMAIFTPLHLQQSSISGDRYISTNLLQGHDPSGKLASHYHFSSLAPAGGATASIYDLVKVVKCNLGESPMKDVCLSTHALSQSASPSNFGWFHSLSHLTFFVKGQTNGFSSLVAIMPSHSCGVIVLANEQMDISNIASYYLDKYFCSEIK